MKKKLKDYHSDRFVMAGAFANLRRIAYTFPTPVQLKQVQDLQHHMSEALRIRYEKECK